MKKHRLTINCDHETLREISNVAKQNGTSQSNISRMLLYMIHYVPAEKLKETSPVPSIFGLNNNSKEIT